MVPKMTSAQYAGGYMIRVTFSDGTTGTVDLEPELWGEVFEPLKDIQAFRQFSIHPEFHTICWANGADFAPEYLYAVAAQQVARADA